MGIDEPGIDCAVEGLDTLWRLLRRHPREPRHACINTALVPAASERGLVFFLIFERPCWDWITAGPLPQQPLKTRPLRW